MRAMSTVTKPQMKGTQNLKSSASTMLMAQFSILNCHLLQNLLEWVQLILLESNTQFPPPVSLMQRPQKVRYLLRSHLFL